MQELSCVKCKKTKLVSLFYKDSHRKKRGYDPYCIECRRESNSTDIRIIKFINKGSASCVSVPLSKVCTKCKTLKSTLEFDNDATKRDGKRSHCRECRKKYANEYAKRPEVIKRTAAYNSNYNATKNKNRREKINKIKQRFGCIDCGYNEHPVALHFDHIDPSKKAYSVSEMYRHSLKNIFDEIRKCVIRCANCHAVKTHNEGDHLTRREG